MAPRIGVYICHCGINIAATVDTEAVAEYAARLPHVVVARDYMYMCSDPGQEMIQQDIRDYDLNRVVVASCSPRMHETTFRTVIEEVGSIPTTLRWPTSASRLVGAHRPRDWHAKGQGTGRRHRGQGGPAGAAGGAGGGRHPAALIIGGGSPGWRRRWTSPTPATRSTWWSSSPAWAGGWPSSTRPSPYGGCRSTGCLGNGAGDGAPQHRGAGLQRGGGRRGLLGNFEVTVRGSHASWIGQVHLVRQMRRGLCLGGQIADEFQMGLGRRAAIYRSSRGHCQHLHRRPGHCLLIKDGQCEEGPPCALACPEDAVALTAGAGSHTEGRRHRRRHRLRPLRCPAQARVWLWMLSRRGLGIGVRAAGRGERPDQRAHRHPRNR